MNHFLKGLIYCMSIVGIIPARYRSSRFPGKPLVDIAGKPMIQHVYERATRCRRLDRLLVATDDQRILEIVHQFGGESLLTSEDHQSGTDRIAEAAEKLRLEASDIVVNIQGDEPLLEPSMIDRLIRVLHQYEQRCMATLAFASKSQEEYLNPNVVKVVTDKSFKALYFSRSPIPCHRDGSGENIQFLKHLGFYAYRQDFLRVFTTLPPGTLEKAEKLEQLRALEYGYSIHVALSETETYGVDTPEDLAKLLNSNRQRMDR